jgi:hypothetical protein
MLALEVWLSYWDATNHDTSRLTNPLPVDMASPLLTMVEVAAANGCPKRQAMRTEYQLIARREARELARRALKIEGLLDACKESLNRWEDDSRWAAQRSHRP